MKNLRNLLLFTISMLGIYCNAENQATEEQPIIYDNCYFSVAGAESTERYYLFDNYFTPQNLENKSPIEMLLFLKKEKGHIQHITADTCRFPQNWIKEEDVIQLKSMLSDTSQVPMVCTSWEIRQNVSYEESLKRRRSTIGKEALHLLNGYLTKRYPCEVIVWDETDIHSKL